jgi:hypothetical protein
MKGGEIKMKYSMLEEGRRMECEITTGYSPGESVIF